LIAIGILLVLLIGILVKDVVVFKKKSKAAGETKRPKNSALLSGANKAEENLTKPKI
jgi:hypothetical protein